jgi:hypothetical protein
MAQHRSTAFSVAPMASGVQDDDRSERDHSAAAGRNLFYKTGWKSSLRELLKVDGKKKARNRLYRYNNNSLFVIVGGHNL